MLTYLQSISTITVTNISQSFSYNMAAKINWHRYGTKLRHCPPKFPVIVVVYVATSSVTKIHINRVTAMSLLQHCVYHAMVTFHGGSFMSREHTRGCRKRKKRTPSLQLRAVHTYAARRCTALVKTHSLCFHERSNAQRSVCVNTTAKMHRVTISRTPTRGVPTRPYV